MIKMSCSNSQSSVSHDPNFNPVRSQNSIIVINYFTQINDRPYQCNIFKHVGKQQQKAGHGNLV